jgi:SAM-dependent methyltransferase
MPFPTMTWLPEDTCYDDLVRLLTACYEEELRHGDNQYFGEHAQADWIANHVRVFRWYWPHVSESTRVLDWGCQHGPDAVLVHACAPSAAIDGCDFAEDAAYPVFRAASQLNYTRLSHTARLPYSDDAFDLVIASGVLEHVPSDWACLNELYRVVSPGGRLVVTYLPNWLSLHELRNRLRDGSGHDRLYSRRQAKRLLLHGGFRPMTPILYQTFGWQRQATRVAGHRPVAESIAAALRTAVPAHVVRASTLCFVAEKVTTMR